MIQIKLFIHSKQLKFLKLSSKFNKKFLIFFRKLKTLITTLKLTKEDENMLNSLEDFLKKEKHSLTDIKKVVSLYSKKKIYFFKF